MSARSKKALVRFYVDADMLGLAKLLVRVRTDVTYPGDPGGLLHKRKRPPCPVESPNVYDENWLPIVSGRSWLIITRDWHINDHRREVDAVRENNARMVTLSSKEATNTFTQLEVLMCQWRKVERCLDEPGPFIYEATRTRFHPVPLGEGKLG